MPPVLLPVRGPVGSIARSLFAGLVELIQQIAEPVGDPLTDHIVVHPLQDVPQPSLVFAAQPSSGLSYRGVGLHCRLWRLSCRGFRLNRLAPRRSPAELPSVRSSQSYPAQCPAPGSLRARQSITASKTVRSVGWNFFHARSFTAGNVIGTTGGSRAQFLCGSSIPSLSAALCAGPDRQPSLRRRLRRQIGRA